MRKRDPGATSTVMAGVDIAAGVSQAGGADGRVCLFAGEQGLIFGSGTGL